MRAENEKSSDRSEKVYLISLAAQFLRVLSTLQDNDQQNKKDWVHTGPRSPDVCGEELMVHAVEAFLLTAVGLVPSLNPFFNLLYTVLKCAMRPVPGALLPFALRDQLYRRSFDPPPRPASLPFCLCQFDLPLILLSVCALLLRLPCACVPAP